MSKIYEIYRKCDYRVSSDSRKIEGGELFFALSGENFDGNLYAQKALDAGAKYAVISNKEMAEENEKMIYTPDTLEALQNLAHEHRNALKVKIIALTGTNGKTTTKEMLREVLCTKFSSVGCTQGNLNNHIGVPLTLLSFRPGVRIGVVEMGANHLGEIAKLCEIAKPDVGIITNVGRAHLEGFGSVENIRRAKGELYDYLRNNGGVALVNTDDMLLRKMCMERVGMRCLGYEGEMGVGINLKLFGGYNKTNAIAAISIGKLFGCKIDKMLVALKNYTPTNNRSEVIEKTSGGGNYLIVDCYNANPSSMKVAIEEFLREGGAGKVVILGGMKELGEYSEKEHRKVVEMCQKAERKLFVGEEFNGITKYFNSTQELAEHLEQNPIQGKEILLKGSRTNKLEQLIKLL